MTGPKRERRDTSSRPTDQPKPSALMRYRTLLIGLVALAGVLVIGFVLLQSASGKSYVCNSLLTPPPDQAADGFQTDYLGNTHVPVGSKITYKFCPPTSGNHYNSPPRGPIPAAFYGPSSEQTPGGWVHNLEHGYVALLYRCPSGVPGQGDCASTDEMATLQQWFNDAPPDPACGTRKVLVARFDSMSTPFAVLAWNRALLLDSFGNAELGQADNFAEQWINTSAPEPNSC